MDGYYFITEQDPNYSIKGSRDPLGLQVIWQNAGRKIIPQLSTVSNNVMDFQVLSLAYALKKRFILTDSEFEDFFIPFEQLFAYARHKLNPKLGFNGIMQVRKNVSNSSQKIYIGFREQILSNQKAYGIWGKYNRPYSEMGILNDPYFDSIFNEKLEASPAILKKAEKILTLKKDENKLLNYEKLDVLFPLLEKPKGAEKELFEKYLLADTSGTHEIMHLLKIKEGEMGNLYSQIAYLQKVSSNDKLIANLEFIKNVERTISPLNRVFKYILTKSYWTKEELSNNNFINMWKNEIDIKGFQEDLLNLAQLHSLTNIEIVTGLLARNEIISEKRQSSPWLNFSGNYLEVNHHEGDFVDSNYSPDNHNDFNYFFDSYFSLYKQLMN